RSSVVAATALLLTEPAVALAHDLLDLALPLACPLLLLPLPLHSIPPPFAHITGAVAAVIIAPAAEPAANAIPEIAPPVAIRARGRRHVLTHEQLRRRVGPVRLAAILEHVAAVRIDAVLEDAGRHVPLGDRAIAVVLAHDPAEHRRGETAAGGGTAERTRRVVADPYRRDDFRRVADEPRVRRIVRRSGLARDRAVEPG